MNYIFLTWSLKKLCFKTSNSSFLGPGFFCEFEIRELKIYDFPPNLI